MLLTAFSRPIHEILPVELLLEVADALYATRAGLIDIARLSRVDKALRDVVLSHPTYWNTIRMDSHPSSAAFAKLCAERSRSEPITIDIKFGADLLPSHRANVVSVVTTAAPRLKILSITNADSSFYVQLFTHINAPRLGIVHLDDPSVREPHLDLPLEFERRRALRSVRTLVIRRTKADDEESDPDDEAQGQGFLDFLMESFPDITSLELDTTTNRIFKIWTMRDMDLRDVWQNVESVKVFRSSPSQWVAYSAAFRLATFVEQRNTTELEGCRHIKHLELDTSGKIYEDPLLPGMMKVMEQTIEDVKYGKVSFTPPEWLWRLE